MEVDVTELPLSCLLVPAWGRDESSSNARRSVRRERAAGSAPAMHSFLSPVSKAILVGLFLFAILLILYVILWYICRDVDYDQGI
ncbi:unnamed protein product [Lampetra fluviatilis]